MEMTIEVPVAEPYVVQDVYASGLLRVEHIGGETYRFVFYVNQMSSHGGQERVIVSRIILSADSARDGARRALVEMGSYFIRDCVSCMMSGRH